MGDIGKPQIFFHLVLSWAFLFASSELSLELGDQIPSAIKNYGERQNSNQST
jgi:hypothetical protein